MELCGARVDPRPRLAVLGVFSSETHLAHRNAIRESWLAPDARAGSIVTRFVLRGLHTSASTLAEAACRRDIVLVAGEAHMQRSNGPM